MKEKKFGASSCLPGERQTLKTQTTCDGTSSKNIPQRSVMSLGSAARKDLSLDRHTIPIFSRHFSTQPTQSKLVVAGIHADVQSESGHDVAREFKYSMTPLGGPLRDEVVQAVWYVLQCVCISDYSLPLILGFLFLRYQQWSKDCFFLFFFFFFICNFSLLLLFFLSSSWLTIQA